jgi:hypothetical protein
VDTWADTTTPHGRLFTVILGGLAEFERELIKARTSEGRARAKARGVKLGRRPKLTPYQQREALERRARGAGPGPRSPPRHPGSGSRRALPTTRPRCWRRWRLEAQAGHPCVCIVCVRPSAGRVRAVTIRVRRPDAP